MKKITFKVSTKKEENIVPLIKEVNKISCRIQIDFEHGLVVAENVGNTTIDSVIELINQYFTILTVNIDNTSDEAISADYVVVKEPDSKVDTDGSIEPEKKPTVIGPQSEDDLVIQKVEFENKYVENLVNKFMKTAYWAMYKMNAPEREIGGFIWSLITEISMRYDKKECIEYSVGDIVDCNYGMHLAGEINGGHVSAIVCNITPNNMAYLVPIVKVRENLTSHSYLTFNAPVDAVYYNEHYTGSTVLLDKGRYLRAARLHAIIGRTTPEFLAKVLNQLSSTFDFTGNTVMDDDTKIDTGNNVVEVESESESADNSEVSIAKAKKPVKNVGGGESTLLNVIGNSLEKLDCTKKVEEQIVSFLTEIGMTTTEQMVTQSFVIACDIKKINYENVILELHNMFPKVREDIIKSVLKENFKKWLEQHPEISKKCPRISLMSLLKVFAKKFA